jgi:hypothetical protein
VFAAAMRAMPASVNSSVRDDAPEPDTTGVTDEPRRRPDVCCDDDDVVRKDRAAADELLLFVLAADDDSNVVQSKPQLTHKPSYRTSCVHSSAILVCRCASGVLCLLDCGGIKIQKQSVF